MTGDNFASEITSLSQLADSIYADIQEKQQAQNSRQDTTAIVAKLRRKLQQFSTQISMLDDDLDRAARNPAASGLYVVAHAAQLDACRVL